MYTYFYLVSMSVVAQRPFVPSLFITLSAMWEERGCVRGACVCERACVGGSEVAAGS
jgi:hypothetical protein